VLLITGIGALVIAVGFDAMLYVSKSALNRKYEIQSGQVIALKHQVDGLTLNEKTVKSELAQTQRDLDDLRPEDQKMKDSIGAFALQAAACDSLKRSMNIQDPGV
jgi:hypothetical protein